MTENMIDPEFDKLLVLLESAYKDVIADGSTIDDADEHFAARVRIHEYLHSAILKERQRCANLARTVSAERHGVHRYAVRDHSDDTGDYIADAILEGEK